MKIKFINDWRNIEKFTFIEIGYCPTLNLDMIGSKGGVMYKRKLTITFIILGIGIVLF